MTVCGTGYWPADGPCDSIEADGLGLTEACARAPRSAVILMFPVDLSIRALRELAVSTEEMVMVADLSQRMISSTAAGDADGFNQALRAIGGARLTPDVIDYLARYCIVLSPEWLPDLAEDFRVDFHIAEGPTIAWHATKLLRARRQDDEAEMELVLNSLLDSVHDSEGPRITVFLIRYLSIVAVMAEQQADAAQRAGVSIQGVEGPFGIRMPF